MKSTTHPLEHRADEAAYFKKQADNGASAYRRAVEATTGSLPTWATRKPGGRPRRSGNTAQDSTSGEA